MDKDKLMEKDLYELLDIRHDSDTQVIKKAYRKKALKCHPDKNPDNPHAAALFLELSVAIDILLGEKSRPVYDKLYKARKAAAIRNNLLDDRRKRFKSELEERERQAQNKDSTRTTSFRSTLSEIDRLRKEGSRHLLEEMEKLNREVEEKEERLSNLWQQTDSQRFKPKEKAPTQVKVKWDNEKKSSYDQENLTKIFSKYGDVEFVVINKKKNSAVIELSHQIEALSFAIKLECGYADNPLKVSIVNEARSSEPRPTANLFPSMTSSTQPPETFPDPKSTNSQTEIDYEEQILNRLRQFEQSRRERES